MAYTIGKFGSQSLVNLVWLVGSFYLTAILFVVVVLGLIARIAGFSIFQFLAYIKDELILVLGTSSSESALPRLMEKLEHLGCSKSVVGFVVPTGYSFKGADIVSKRREGSDGGMYARESPHWAATRRARHLLRQWETASKAYPAKSNDSRPDETVSGEPVCGADSLLTGKITGNFRYYGATATSAVRGPCPY